MWQFAIVQFAFDALDAAAASTLSFANVFVGKEKAAIDQLVALVFTPMAECTILRARASHAASAAESAAANKVKVAKGDTRRKALIASEWLTADTLWWEDAMEVMSMATAGSPEAVRKHIIKVLIRISLRFCLMGGIVLKGKEVKAWTR